jgi:hypothetical protein
MSIEPLNYEQTLAELHGFVGTSVAVSLQDANTEFMGATIVGPLRSAKDLDTSKFVPELEGDFAGETMHFLIGDPADAPGFATFAIWKAGFEWGRRVERPHGPIVSLQVAGLQTRVRPSPLGSGLAM